MVKIRRKVIYTPTPTVVLKETAAEFMHECHNLAGAARHKFLREKYKQYFHAEIPKNTEWDMVIYKIGYHLQILELKAKKLPIPEKIQKNYDAAIKFDREALSPILRVKLQDEYASKHSKVVAKYNNQKEEEEMAKVKVVKKEKGITVDNIWVKVLSTAVGKRLTDKAIAVQMNTAVDKVGFKHKKYDEGDVASHRSGYNNGRFKEQAGKKPRTRLERYEPKK